MDPTVCKHVLPEISLIKIQQGIFGTFSSLVTLKELLLNPWLQPSHVTVTSIAIFF